MNLNSCPICVSSRASRRQFLAGLGAVGAAMVLIPPDVRAQAQGTLIDTQCIYLAPRFV